jgi:predicted O-methyltransferase YrrM
MEDIEKLVNYHINNFIIEPDFVLGSEGKTSLFVQVYEEILNLAYWVKGFQPHNILEIGFKGSTFHILSKLSTGKKVAMDIEDAGRSVWSHYMMYDEEFKLFIGNSQTEEMKNKVKEFCPMFDLIFIDADHSYNGVKKDFELYKELLSPRGAILFHDIDPDSPLRGNWRPKTDDVCQFWNDLNEGSKTNLITAKSNGKITCYGLKEHFGGIGIWRP